MKGEESITSAAGKDRNRRRPLLRAGGLHRDPPDLGEHPAAKPAGPATLRDVDGLLAGPDHLELMAARDPFGHEYRPVRHAMHRLLAPDAGWICYVEIAPGGAPKPQTSETDLAPAGHCARRAACSGDGDRPPGSGAYDGHTDGPIVHPFAGFFWPEFSGLGFRAVVMVGPLAYSLTWGEAFRVKHTRPIWRSLRPVLLAAAAATSWLALSAPAASADATPEPAPLVKRASSSVVAVETSARAHAGNVVLQFQLKTERPPARSGSSAVIALPAALPELRPAVRDVAASADGLLHRVPAATALAPANPVAAVTDPVATLADTVVGAASAAVVPVTGTVIEILDPVVRPIIDHAVRPVPSPIPGEGTALPEMLDGGSPGPGVSPSAALSGAREETAPSSAGILADATSESTATGVSFSQTVGAAVRSGNRGPFQLPASVAASAAPEPPAEAPRDALFYPVPAVPGSGSAGSASSGGSPSVPAWLSHHHFIIPSPSASHVRGALLRAPSQVSFEPGSSPD